MKVQRPGLKKLFEIDLREYLHFLTIPPLLSCVCYCLWYRFNFISSREFEANRRVLSEKWNSWWSNKGLDRHIWRMCQVCTKNQPKFSYFSEKKKPIHCKSCMFCIGWTFYRILYEEIDYINEGKNADRFRRDFRNLKWVRVPVCFSPKLATRLLLFGSFIFFISLSFFFFFFSSFLAQSDFLKRFRILFASI